jgi:hypothetical protein
VVPPSQDVEAEGRASATGTAVYQLCLSRVPPMGFISLQGLDMSCGPRDIGFPRCGPSPFPAPCPLFQCDRPPPLAKRVHSLVRPVPFGVCSPFLLAPRFNSAPSCPGVFSLFATSPEVSTERAVPSALRSVHRFSQPLDGLLHFRLYGLVSSRSHVQGFRSGV